MTHQEHLLTIAAEECAEVAQRLSKALRFGMYEVQPGQPLNNRQRIMAEFHDLVAAMELAGLHPRSLDDAEINAKKRKVAEFVTYSGACGTLAAPGPAADPASEER